MYCWFPYKVNSQEVNIHWSAQITTALIKFYDLRLPELQLLSREAGHQTNAQLRIISIGLRALSHKEAIKLGSKCRFSPAQWRSGTGPRGFEITVQFLTSYLKSQLERPWIQRDGTSKNSSGNSLTAAGVVQSSVSRQSIELRFGAWWETTTVFPLNGSDSFWDNHFVDSWWSKTNCSGVGNVLTSLRTVLSR